MNRTRLFNRDFVLLWQGQLVSQLGNQAFLVALLFWTMEATDSASIMGALMAAAALPTVLLGPLGGAVADRHSRKRLIVLADASRGVAVLAVAALVILQPERTGLIVAALFAVCVFSGVAAAVFQPAVTAAIPDLVPTERVAAANSINQASLQGSQLVGQALGGVLFRFLGAPVLFLVDGVSYLLSALSEAFIRLPHASRSEELTPKAALRAYLDDTREGIEWVWQRTGIRAFLVTATTLNFLAMPIMVLLPFYVTDILGREADWYGYLLASLGLGAAVGLGLAAGLRLEPRSRGWLLRSAFLIAPFLLAGLGLVTSPWAAAALTFSVGLIGGLINIFVITLLQLSTPSEMRGRVFGLMIALARAATPVGMALGGVVGDLTARNVPAVYVGVGALALVVSLLAVASPAFRDFLGSDPATAATVEAS